LGFRDPDVKDSYFLAHYAASLDNGFPTLRKNIMPVSLKIGNPKIVIFVSLVKFILIKPM